MGASFEVHLIRSDRASRECESEDCALFMSAHKGLDYSIGYVKEISKSVKTCTNNLCKKVVRTSILQKADLKYNIDRWDIV